MPEERMPAGWSESKIAELILHYESQDEDQAVREDEARAASSTPTITVAMARERLMAVAKLAARAVESLTDSDVLKLYSEYLATEAQAKKQAG